MKSFRQYLVPSSPEEAVELKEAIGSKAIYLAGGTSVVPFARESVEVVIDITRCGLDGISSDEDSIRLGAAVRISELLREPIMSSVPLLYETARRCATPQVRNMATVGGNVAVSYLPADIALSLLALDAQVEVFSGSYQSFTFDELLERGFLRDGELVTSICLPKIGECKGCAFLKFGRSEIDIGIVCVSLCITLSEGRVERLRIAIGQTSSMPVLVRVAAEEAVGKTLDLSLIHI